MSSQQLEKNEVDDRVPLHAGLLSNGRYAVLLDEAGSGFSSCDGMALTRWQGDRIENTDGFFVYLRDLDTEHFWSVGIQPTLVTPERYEARCDLGRITIARLDMEIETRMEVCVLCEADCELRRIRLINHSSRSRRIELTSYLEVVAQWAAADAAHPAFSKLFVQTEHDSGVLLARRRPRSAAESSPWVSAALHGPGALSYETDRMRFIGRGRDLSRPLALDSSAPLSGTAGNVLDPILSLRRVVALKPGSEAECTLVLGAATSREAALRLAGQHGLGTAVDAAFAGAAASEDMLLRRLALSADQAERLQALGAALLYGEPALRAAPEVVARARGRSSDLQRWGLSGTVPLVLARPPSGLAPERLRDLVQAQSYWALKSLAVDLVVVAKGSVRQVLADQRAVIERLTLPHGNRGKLVVLHPSEITAAQLELLETAAHCIIWGTLTDLVLPATSRISKTPGARYRAIEERSEEHALQEPCEPTPLFDNGYGGFAADGLEYLIRVAPRKSDKRGLPPLPWINVIATRGFGCLVSERGAGTTWARNSRENRLTPWYNDPVIDPHGEALYLRDEEAGVYWSPLPGPSPSASAYEVRHGFGYTRCLHTSLDLTQETVVFVARDTPVKLTQVRLVNISQKPNRLSIFFYHRLVLGTSARESARFVVTEYKPECGTLLARNHLNNEFSDGVVFAAAVMPKDSSLSFTADRMEFIGRYGSPAQPRALLNAAGLEGRTGALLDPCMALQLSLELAAGGASECTFLFGEAGVGVSIDALVARYREPAAVAQALEEVREDWTRRLAAVRIETPAPALDLLVNGWLPYQTLSARLWARSAFYQSGGAFGFRDQLQDAAALIYWDPAITRAQILLHAEHQFAEGDVLHWWHPPDDRGTRTRFSDDLLWLPYGVAFYIQNTGDWAILEEVIEFLTARSLEPGEDETYLAPRRAGEFGDLYEHCCRALDRSLTRGAHGLPLMGTGDWNDGMNRVGRSGRGESVWLGFFLYAILGDFIPLCAQRGDGARIERYRSYRESLLEALNQAGWDGSWYRRAYYDDGTPLGSAQGDECRIDAVAQAWAVISQAAPPDRAQRAMDAVERFLISETDGIIRLLAPPFDRTPKDPGYIKGYVPGVRENGGQYTHAALWVVQAMAGLGRRDRALALLEMLSPIHHACDPAAVARYKVEPYVLAADLYGVQPHIGRGGWTWYTGSAGWMLRVALESVLGLKIESGRWLKLRPRIPDHWPGFTLHYRIPEGKTQYAIRVRNSSGRAERVVSATVDGTQAPIEDGWACIALVRDGKVHEVEVLLRPVGPG
ncbi:MAG: GH36-type glycosyl hydrolase domain-containing protein [Gammaproteobacteria bacterium]